MDSILFYSGLVAAGLTAALGLIFAVVYHINGIRLKYEFDKEYGEAPSKKNTK